MSTIYIDFINRFFPSIDLRGIVNILNSDFPSGNLAIYNIINREYPTIRDCSRTITTIFHGNNEQINFRISYGIVVSSTKEVNVSAEGMIDDKQLIKKLFDNLPNYFASLEEQEDEN